MTYTEKYNLWLERVKDEQVLTELKNMNEEQISSAFFKDVEFGTAGMRGIVGAGSNCMNIYTVGKVTEAVAKYLTERKNPRLAVSFDSRHMSVEFAELVARICSKYGIEVYISKDMMPTPFLSYMVRYYKCDLGVMITASHNPKEYNGYKLYDSDGCQLLEEPSKAIMEIADTIDMFNVSMPPLEEGISKGLVKYIDNNVVESYFESVEKVSLNKVENLKVVYTALNGTGANTTPQMLVRRGADVSLVNIQCKKDSDFTTCVNPNPERKDVFALAEELASNVNADIIVATDPDADRVGVEVNKNGSYEHLTGNEVGALLTDYILSNKTQSGYIVRSIVSTSLVDKLAEKYGAKVKTVLTGFKYIGDFIKNLENQNREQEYLLGFEESYGYLAGSYVRDKDATCASMLICEMASELKKQGKTLIDRLNELYAEFGLYEHHVKSYRFEGKSGNEKMKQLLGDLRSNPFGEIAENKVIKVVDYSSSVDGLPCADVLSYDLSNGGNVIVRPSGTEPLIKVYITFVKNKEENAKDFENTEKFFKEYFV